MFATASKEDKLLYCANVLLSIAAKENIQIFALTSSFSDLEKQSTVTGKLIEKISQLGKKALLLDMKSETAEDIQKKLEENDIRKNNDLVFVNLLPVDKHFRAIQTAQKCQGTILLEKYTRTKHQEFDELMETLKHNEIHVCGVVTY